MNINCKRRQNLFERGEALLNHYDNICAYQEIGELYIEKMGESGYGSTLTRELEENLGYVTSYEISKHHIAIVPIK